MRYIQLSKKQIDDIFESAKRQTDYLLALYNYVIPEFDKLLCVGGFPAVSKITSDYIFEKAINFDQVHHKNIVLGGCWLNSGFGTSSEVDDWMVMVDETQFVYKEDNN